MCSFHIDNGVILKNIGVTFVGQPLSLGKARKNDKKKNKISVGYIRNPIKIFTRIITVNLSLIKVNVNY